MEEWNRYDKCETVSFESLKGKTLKTINGLEKSSEDIEFISAEGERFTLRYYDDCCASCTIEDVCGDVKDLVGHPILLAECIESHDPDDATKAERKAYYEAEKAKGGYLSSYEPNPENDWHEESETWSFYKLSTIKGSVTIRWYGSSNGYYSETCTFEKWK